MLSESPEDIRKEASLATRRQHRQNHQLPKQFMDILPQAQPSLPPPNLNPPSPPTTPNGELQTGFSHTLALATRKILHTPQNLFGLVRQYYTDKFPSIDPEEEVTLNYQTIQLHLPKMRSVFSLFPMKAPFA